jgi:plastocyanin
MVVCVVALSSCVDDANDARSSDQAETIGGVAAVIGVAALDNSFRPQIVEITVGDQVSWENRGLNSHNVLSVVGGDWGVTVDDFEPGAVFVHQFTEPGEYHYFCSIHGNETIGMVGTVIVTA